MDASIPSRTAQGAAMHRAAHQILDNPLVFEDPLAIRIIGREAADDLRSGRDWHGRLSNGLRAFIAARSRVAEDCLAESIQTGSSQYVLLGAGLDTFAYRGRSAALGLKIFEIDHPATQAWKRARLAETDIPVASNVSYVAVDFEVDSLDDRLRAAGFDFARPATFAWLGVTPYLLQQNVLETLKYIACATARGSEIVFDFAEPADDRDPELRAAITALAERVAALGEPLRSFFEPAILERELTAMGFVRVRDFDTAALNAMYFRERNDGLLLRGHGHVMIAGK